MRGDHRNVAVIRVRAGGDTWCSRICTSKGLNCSVEDGGDRLLEGFAIMPPSGPVGIWVGRGR